LPIFFPGWINDGGSGFLKPPPGWCLSFVGGLKRWGPRGFFATGAPFLGENGFLGVTIFQGGPPLCKGFLCKWFLGDPPLGEKRHTLVWRNTWGHFVGNSAPRFPREMLFGPEKLRLLEGCPPWRPPVLCGRPQRGVS